MREGKFLIYLGGPGFSPAVTIRFSIGLNRLRKSLMGIGLSGTGTLACKSGCAT
jgi:hypothetical protein